MSLYGSYEEVEWLVPDFGSVELWLVGGLLFGAGLIMTAAGTGGGGVFVPILIGVGSLTSHEAIPLSKFVIFAGSIATLLVNTTSSKRAEIDFPKVRAIVPLSLAGTLVGVMLNLLLAEPILMLVLACLLFLLFVKSVHMAGVSLRGERLAQAGTDPSLRKERGLPTILGKLGDPTQFVESTQAGVSEWNRNAVMVGLVPLVVTFGVTSKIHSLDFGVQLFLILIPIVACTVTACVFYRIDKVALSYPLVGLLGGVASGLFGLGGGLIYSPFLLNDGVDPAVAIAVSSTCVFFASASSTFQYLFMGRIGILFGLFFSAFTIVASLIAGIAVWLLTKKLNRPAYLFCIVAVVVGVCFTFTLVKSIMLMLE